jgi:hypothetical protein
LTLGLKASLAVEALLLADYETQLAAQRRAMGGGIWIRCTPVLPGVSAPSASSRAIPSLRLTWKFSP